MPAQNDCYKEMLVRKGIKSTRQRIAALEALCNSPVPLTAEDIFLKIRDCSNNLSFSTVYRILDMLSKKGVVTKSVLIEGGKALFEITPEVHGHNLICVKCHKITPLKECPLGDYERHIEEVTGYNISGHKLEVYGICPECSAGHYSATGSK